MGRPYALLSFIWALVMFIGASRPLPSKWCGLFPYEDGLWHFLQFALLTALVYKAFEHSSETRIAARSVVLTLLVVLPYAAALEIYQWYVPFRECSLFDFLANCAGVAGAIFLVRDSHG
jgi:VanZ family protein